MIETKVNEKYAETYRFTAHENEHPEAEAKLAFEFIKRWGLVMAADDGEDSVGRQKFRLATPQELIDRAFSIAHLAMDKARSTGLIHQGPTLADLEKPDKTD